MKAANGAIYDADGELILSSVGWANRFGSDERRQKAAQFVAALNLLGRALDDWGETVDDADADISGSDAVEWLCQFVRAAQDIIKDPKFKGELKL
jgi:hypothetical protein